MIDCWKVPGPCWRIRICLLRSGNARRRFLKADTAWRRMDARIEALQREADRTLHERRDLVEWAAGESCLVVETAGYADWITAVTMIEATWQDMSNDRDFRTILAARPKSARAIAACLGTFRAAQACDDACARFEALRRAVHERAAAGNTIPFPCRRSRRSRPASTFAGGDEERTGSRCARQCAR